ncbi:unnamed protein product [Lathyrus oleraceus]
MFFLIICLIFVLKFRRLLADSVIFRMIYTLSYSIANEVSRREEMPEHANEVPPCTTEIPDKSVIAW